MLLAYEKMFVLFFTIFYFVKFLHRIFYFLKNFLEFQKMWCLIMLLKVREGLVIY